MKIQSINNNANIILLDCNDRLDMEPHLLIDNQLRNEKIIAGITKHQALNAICITFKAIY